MENLDQIKEETSPTPLPSESNTPQNLTIISFPTFKEKLWGQCEPLHKKNVQTVEHYEICFKKLVSISNNFQELLKELKNTIFTFESQGSSSTGDKIDFKRMVKDVPYTINCIKNDLEQQIEQNNQIISSILIIFSNYIQSMKKEKKEYDDFKKLYNSYISSYLERKKLIEKNMKIYHQKAEIAEKAVLSLKKIEETSENLSDDNSYFKAVEKANNSLEDYIKPYNIYKENVKKENDFRNELIKKQNNLLELYYNLENKYDLLNEDMIQIYIQYAKNQIIFNNENAEDFEFMKKSFKKGENINKLVNTFSSNEFGKLEKETKFIHFPSLIDFDICDNSKTFNIYLQSILFIKKINNEEYPNFNEEIEKEKNDMREIIRRLFDEYTEDREAKIMNYIKNPLRHNSFFTILSKFRNKNCLNKDKKLFDLFGNILNLILDETYNNQDYDNAKNCIIFAQTFFYISEDNIKHFLLETIKKHKWIGTFDFWKNFIFNNINQELNKFLTFYDDITINDIIQKNEKITEKIQIKLSDLLFSQILPYMNNMNEFGVDKEIITQIIKELCSNYKYLNEEKIEGILGMVFKDNKEIRKIKENIKEYIVDFNPDKTTKDKKEIKDSKKKRSQLNIKYDHLKKEEKQIDNPL